MLLGVQCFEMGHSRYPSCFHPIVKVVTTGEEETDTAATSFDERVTNCAVPSARVHAMCASVRTAQGFSPSIARSPSLLSFEEL